MHHIAMYSLATLCILVYADKLIAFKLLLGYMYTYITNIIAASWLRWRTLILGWHEYLCICMFVCAQSCTRKQQ